jgi:hypothetical protein
MALLVTPLVLGAVFDLNQPANYLHWHFFQMSVSNIVVIIAMIIVFLVAILAPFPTHGSGADSS